MNRPSRTSPTRRMAAHPFESQSPPTLRARYDRQAPDPVFQEEVGGLFDRRLAMDGHDSAGHDLPDADLFGQVRDLVHLEARRPGGERVPERSEERRVGKEGR